RLLARDPAVIAVQLNGRARPHVLAAQPTTLPNDPYYPNQSWHYAMIDLPRAWSITTGSSSVIVAVLDAGIRFDHPAIGMAGGTYLTGGGNLRTDGYDFVSAGDSVPLCAGGKLDNADDGDGYDPDPTIPDDRPFSGSCLGDPSQAGGHGLHVAGTIGAVGNDGVSVTGVNWQVGIRPVRVIGVESGSYWDIAQGILYAAGLPADDGHGGVLTPPAQRARIINMSFGGTCIAGPTPAPGVDVMHDAVAAVTDSLPPAERVLLVASAGNSSSSTAPCPAAYPEVLAVGAVGPSGSRASYSNFGPWVGVAAPGGETSAPDATYWVYSSTCDFTKTPCAPLQSRLVGTSMAAPHVSGVAALLLAQDPALTSAQLRARLTTYVTPVDPAQGIGPGIVNAYLALTQGAVPARQLYVTAYDASTGSPVATVAASGGSYTIPNLPDGSYFVYAGEDEDGDGLIGLPDRRFGAWGGAATPTPVQVTSNAGAFVSFTIGNPVEREPNNAVPPGSRLVLGGSIRGSLDAQDPVDLYRIDLPAGTYSFETHGWFGDFCSFALDVNTTLDLLDAGQGVLQTSVDLLPQPAGNNYCSRITATVGAGTYYLRVTPGLFFDGSPHSGRYVLWARPGP
ncbi:MAG TPA: S8 family serine peptidase, partial [Gemmatimonadales bacterium]|nr:S8 family serine peptidase [Gemmatimonadales bacterium]